MSFFTVLPKRFRDRLTLLFGGLTLLCVVGVVMYVDRIASKRITESSGRELLFVGNAMANMLATTMAEREREILLMSQRPLLMREHLGSNEVRQQLNLVRNSYKHYAWIGIADPQGHVLSAGGGLLEGKDVSARDWFIAGLRGLYVGDAHEAVLLAKMLPANPSGEPLRFVDFAAPIFDEHSRLRGVIAAHANWSWVSEVLDNALPQAADEKGVEVFVLNQQGEVLHPFSHIGTRIPELPALNEFAVVEWQAKQPYLTAYTNVRPTAASNLGWKVVVREPLSIALAPVIELNRALLMLGAVLTVLVIVLVYRASAKLSWPLEQLARIARAVGDQQQPVKFAVSGGITEIEQLSQSLQTMTERLIAHQHELEQKVQERTAELEAANAYLDEIAHQDALTGLHNRRAANQFLRSEFMRMKRSESRYSLLLIDIDHFKRVNDQFGHDVGDQVLSFVAHILKQTARQTDFVARTGGEEFLVILPDTEDRDGLVAEKFRSAVAHAPAPHGERVTVSIGVVIAQLRDSDEDSALRRADKALYQAKANGRNRVERSTSN